jgi:hypothetical protein
MANRREVAPAAWFILFYFIFKLNRFGSVRFGFAGLGTQKLEIEPNWIFF